MVVKAIPNVKSIARNGCGGTFVYPCRKVTLQYCNWGGSSQGLRDYLMTSKVNQWAQRYPQVEFEIVKKSGHPVLKGEYINGRDKAICVKNMEGPVIDKKLQIILDSSGDILRKWTKNENVLTSNSSVRGIWSPFH